MKENFDLLSNAIGCLIAIIILFLVSFSGMFLSAWQCPRSFPDKETRFVYFVGCQIKTSDGWIPSKNYRILN